ncbi:MAG: hypothetical protein Q9187_004953, partial [Circinaria calcarea]
HTKFNSSIPTRPRTSTSPSVIHKEPKETLESAGKGEKERKRKGKGKLLKRIFLSLLVPQQTIYISLYFFPSFYLFLLPHGVP